ncbi:GAF domain-containing sensor histidine kinase [Roseisolibacter sp. H3M3-2]|uniref:GAF domain-containing sensor histidine kinase n=1 Tax=Roseisolibacter sp. H3M3-2 TaxID=3031323 RepID=UPI0023DCE265|nr:GAF domain-containing sensor histidine kinase [Roseisolibacter sp. H3M3-2]MDF1502156.1 GAF domain-containing sensor histidine kinase [Roseisolibacter sp. H3M3-2]
MPAPHRAEPDLFQASLTPPAPREVEVTPYFERASPTERTMAKVADEAAATAQLALRELAAVREIARALHTADRLEELYQFALERVTPLLGASFASVYVREGHDETMRLAAAHNWPERFVAWMGQARIRIGMGPSGEAAAERRMVEVPDVFADPALADWQEVARELGFRALVALPLAANGARGTAPHVFGAIAFYFAGESTLADDQRWLLRVVADQLAAAAEKAHLIDELRRANAALVESNAELERQYVAVLEARRVKDEFLANMSHELRTPLAAVQGYVGLMLDELSGPLTAAQREDLVRVRGAGGRLLDLIDNLLELTTLKRGGLEVHVEECDPRAPLQDAIAQTPGRPPTVTLRVEEPTTMLPPLRSDRKKIAKLLVSLLANAYKFTPAGEVVAAVEVRDGRVAYRVQDTGIGIPSDAQQMVFDEFRQVDGSAVRKYGGSGLGLALARRIARLLGGDVDLTSAVGEGSTFTVELPLDFEPPVDPRSALETPHLGVPVVPRRV